MKEDIRSKSFDNSDVRRNDARTNQPVIDHDATPNASGGLSEKSQDNAPSELSAQAPLQSNALEHQKPADDGPPDGGYGWVCVAAIFWINAHTWGLNSSYAVFLAYYLSTNAFPGTTRLDYACVGGLSISVALLVSPIVTTVIRLRGTRTALLIGVFFEAASFIGASFVNSTYQLFLSQGVCFGIGMGFLFVASVSITPQWFLKRRSLANGIGAAGSGLGGLTYSLATNAMIKQIGLPWAFRTLGIVAFVVTFTCSILLRDRNKQTGSAILAFDHTLFKRKEFLLLQSYGIFSMLGYVVLLFSLPSYARSIGLTAKQGSVIGAVLNLGQAAGRPPIGYFSDSMGRINMAGTMTFLASLFCFVIWIFAKSYGVLIFFAFIGGTVAGTYWATIAPVAAEVVGLRHIPACLSITWLMLAPPTFASEPIGLAIVDTNHGGYLGTQLFAGCMYLAAAASMLLLRAWKIGELEELAAAEDKSPTSIDPTASKPETGGSEAGNMAKFKKSNLMKRLWMVRKV